VGEFGNKNRLCAGFCCLDAVDAGLMRVEKQNLYANLSGPLSGEDFVELLRCRNVVIERIVSSDRPEPRVYDQPQDEWVILLQGQASLEIAGETLHLAAGDHVFIPAHTAHRVLTTSRDPVCIWLTVHIHPDSS
jgi:cupin 2 domain-containing protein